jgi:hypothetical protein
VSSDRSITNRTCRCRRKLMSSGSGRPSGRNYRLPRWRGGSSVAVERAEDAYRHGNCSPLTNRIRYRRSSVAICTLKPCWISKANRVADAPCALGLGYREQYQTLRNCVMNYEFRTIWLRSLMLLLLAAPSSGLCTSGEVLLQGLRDQVDIQRHMMSPEELDRANGSLGRNPRDIGNGALVECSSESLAAFREAGGLRPADESKAFIYNAAYTQVRLPVGHDFCVYIKQPVDRPLSVDEARDLYVAEHVDFPDYDPPAADLQLGEEEFRSLRDKARERESIDESRRQAVERVSAYVVQCHEEELGLKAKGGLRRRSEGENQEDIDSVNYEWGFAQSVDGDLCLYIRSPIHRALTVEEARDLMTMSTIPPLSMEGSVPPTGKRSTLIKPIPETQRERRP